MDEPQIILFIGDPYRCDRALAKREEEIFSREISDGTFVSLIATELKGKSPILKACRKRGAVVSLPAPRGRGMTRAAAGILAERGLEVEEESIDVLLNRTGGRLIALAREAEKLRSFARTGGLTRGT